MIFQAFTGTGIITQCIARKEARILDHAGSWVSFLISIKIDPLLYPLFTWELDPSLGIVQAALHLCEREEGPMPNKVSYIEHFL